MNYKLLGRILGKIMILEGILMIAPLIVTFIYQEFNKNVYPNGGIKNILAFAIPIVVLFSFGIALQFPKPSRRSLYQKEGFALVAMVWIVMTLFGALPFVINGDIPNYINACFETMSGFTTTGASIIDYDITSLAHSSLFWRSFTHWIGGMGILVFVLIFIPESKDGSAMHLLRAESPGPQVGKIVSKMRATARILYLIYFGMTALLTIILICIPLIDYGNPAISEVVSSKNKVFHAFLMAFGCAGTGGFGFIPGSIQYFTPVAQYVVAIALFMFGINFTLYYLILIGKIKDVFRSEEVKTYFAIIVAAVGLIFLSLQLGNLIDTLDYSTEEAFRHSLLQVASLLTTAGFSSTDFDVWPMLAKMVLVICMFMGGMAGSTAGGIKTSRFVMAIKGSYINIRKLINPRYVPKAKFEGKLLEEKTMNDVFAFFTMYAFIFIIVMLILSFDPVNGTTFYITSDAGANREVTHGFFTNFSAVASCMSNIGPGFEAVGPYASFNGFSYFSKIVLTFTMLIGRLEILPVFILFSPRTWKKI
ncbi:MAG: TrkH family potassium uptake protein [Clostridia bacterium]|nr:TrkH family potassium uptake protein [Clostridia bacterium]